MPAGHRVGARTCTGVRRPARVRGVHADAPGVESVLAEASPAAGPTRTFAPREVEAQKPGVSIGPVDWPVMNCWTIGSGLACSSAGVPTAWTRPW